MSVEQIVAALQAIVAEATGGQDPDPNNPDAVANTAPQLTEDQARRYEALEAQLLVARRSEEILKRNAAYKSVNTPVIVTGDRSENSEMARAFDGFIRSGGRDNRDYLTRAQSEASGPAGGFLVPPMFRDKLTEKLKAFGGLQNAAEAVATASGAPLSWLTNDDVLSTEAGIIAENAANTFGADFVFGTRALGAFKYDTAGASGLFLKVPWELLQDSTFDIQSFIARKFGERIARKLAVDLVNGTGVNEPQGIISTQGALTSSGVTVTSATAGPTYAELVTIEHSLDPAYRDNASWLMNDKTVSLIEALVDTAGRPLIWSAGNSLSEGRMPKTLLGYPVIIDQAMPDLLTGSTKGMVFGDLRQAYVVRSIKDVSVVTVNELYAANGQVGFMAWARYDGMVQDANAAVSVTSHA